MTLPPLPDIGCVRVSLRYAGTPGTLFGNRFYISYTGTAPSGANCTTLAGDIETAWAAHMAAITSTEWALEEVDVLDIATRTGLSGQWTGATDGSRTGVALTQNVATNVEFGISRRYRGGKPRIYLPPGNQGDLADPSHWTSGYISAVQTAVPAFFGAIEALTIGGMGTLTHVTLNYYHGFTNKTDSSGRAYAAPNYTAVATHDNVTGYFPKVLVSQQRRRRTSIT